MLKTLTVTFHYSSNSMIAIQCKYTIVTLAVLLATVLSYFREAYPIAASYNNYRFLDSVSAVRRETTPYNASIVEEYERIMGGKHKLQTNDTLVPFVDPFPVDSIINRDIQVCTKDTFFLAIFPIRSSDYRMRQLLRRMIPQGMVVKNKVINRIFVVGIDDMDKQTIKMIREENRVHGDIVVSRHKESYYGITILLWDGLMWVKEHCNQAKYVGKFDPDAVIFMDNIIEVLKNAPMNRFYGGRKLSFVMQPRKNLTRWCLPYDYPERRGVVYLSGPAMLLSMDLVDYLLIGADYEPFFIGNDDIMVGSVLNRVGIFPQSIGLDNCPFMIWRTDNNSYYSDYKVLPNCVCVYHDVKNYAKYCDIVHFFNITTCSD